MMISNQYQVQPNFQGNLLQEGLKLPQKKFNEVAKLYAEKTKGMPDLYLYGMRHYMDDHFYYSTYAINSKENIGKSGCRALIDTEALKKMFADYSPIKMAKELVNINRQFMSINKIEKLDKELDALYAEMNSIRNQIKNSTSFMEKDELQLCLDKIERRIEQKEETIINLKREYQYAKNDFSNEWEIIEV